jgi:glycine cleavage system H protein
VRVGITKFAAERLSDIVYVELPAVGTAVKATEAFGVVESVKAVSDLYAPVSGKVVEVNRVLDDAPEQVNKDPYGAGWMVLIELSKRDEMSTLLDAPTYRKLVGD